MRGVVYEAEEATWAAAEKGGGEDDDDDDEGNEDYGEDADFEDEADDAGSGGAGYGRAAPSLRQLADADAGALAQFDGGLADARHTASRLLARGSGALLAPSGSSSSPPPPLSVGGGAPPNDGSAPAPASAPLDMAMALLQELKETAKLQPNFVTYSALLAACAKARKDSRLFLKGGTPP
jgi:hypothetical protein